MRRAGCERVVDALLSAPRVSARGFILLFSDIDRRAQEEKAYKIYITDALKIFGRLNIRYADILSGRTDAAEETRSEEEIKEHICSLLEQMEAKGK